MAPQGKGSRRTEKFKLATSPFVQDSIQAKVQRWNLVEPDSPSKEESNSLSASEKESSLKSGRESKSSSKPTSKSDESTDTESDKAEEKDTENTEGPKDGTSNKQPAKKRARSKTVGDDRVVEWPTTPDRPKSSEKVPHTAPAKHIIATPKGTHQRNHGLANDLKQASAPRKRIVSDGHWVRVRNPPKKESLPKPKPEPKAKVVKLANGPAGLAWVRPPLLPRKESNPEPPPKPVAAPEPPVLKTYTGKMRKPIWHQFDVEKERARLKARDEAINAANDMLDFRRSKNWNTPAGRRALLQKSQEKDDEESDEPDESDDDLETLSEPEIRRRSPVINRNTSIQKSPPQISYKKRRAKSDEDVHESQISYREPERIPLSSHSRRHSGTQKSPPRRENPVQLPGRYHRRGQSTGDLIEHETEIRRNVPYEEERKPSYNAEDIVPIDDETPPHVPALGIPGRLAAWLTSTPDPFTTTPDKSEKPEKMSKPSFAKRLFSFEKDKPEPKIQSPSPRSQMKDQEGSAGQSTRSRGRDSTYTSRTPTKESSRRNLEGVDPEIEVEYASSTSTPTLKRSGARKNYGSPAREPLRSPTIKEDVQSEISASVLTTSEVTITTESSSQFTTPTKREEPEPRRKFPSTGKRLSTIVSVDTLGSLAKQQEAESVITASEVTEKQDRRSTREVSISEPPHEKSTTAKLDLEKLAIPRDRTSAMSRAKSVVSVRSTRSIRTKLANTTISDIMADLAADEESFMPELRTLVGGVIKVLFRAVLSKSDAAVAAGLFSKFLADKGSEKDAKRAIHEMGVALERLKSYHIRIPTEDSKSFLIWAQGAHKIYAEYVRTWRLGFQDVVVELVPEDDSSTISRDFDGNSMADAMPRNEKGYVVNQQGELVDVAFLLKRPLVRLKFLNKTIKALNVLQPTEESAKLTKKYEELMESARRKVNSERARIEDQRAAMIDSRRARDPTNMGALSGVKIDPTRCVRARDFFDMHLIHSSGQEVLSRIEILIRDDPPRSGTTSGDILLCQVDDHGKWLFLPPILLKNVSARKGSETDELILMIRGVHSGGAEWRELMSLKCGDGDVALEWIHMLGTSPIPTSFSRAVIVKEGLTVPHLRPPSSHGSSLLSGSAYTDSTDQHGLSRPPSPTATEILPIGERAGPEAKRWGSVTPDRSGTASPVTPASSTISGERERKVSPGELYKRLGSGNHGTSKRQPSSGGRKSKILEEKSPEPADLNDAMAHAGHGLSNLKRSRATRHRSSSISPTGKETDRARLNTVDMHKLRKPSESAVNEPVKSNARDSRSRTTPSTQKGYSVWMPSSNSGQDSDEDEADSHFSITSSQAPSLHRRSSSLPLKPESHSRSRRIPDRYSSVSILSSVDSSSDIHNKRPYDSVPTTPHRKSAERQADEVPPPPPPHRTPVAKQGSPAKIVVPQLTPSAISNLKRRSSSPLKHEYQPSSGSERSQSDNEFSDPYDDDDDFLESSESEVESEGIQDLPKSRGHDLPVQPEEAVADTITPSQSASQGPFRDVPETKNVYFTTLAGISRWQMGGDYVNLHHKECLIEVSPGKIAAYETVPDLVYPNITKLPDRDPVIALHLTPGILLQVTSACDIIIRSKPTHDSHFQVKHGGGVYIRFHTRHPSVREALQDHVSHAMTTNPTFLALERARPKETEAERFDRQNPGHKATAGGKSWWGGSRRTSSFRKANTRSGSTVGNTENTYRTTSSLKRSINHILTKATGFNIEKSAIFSKSRGKESSGAHTRSNDGDGSPSQAPPPPRDAFARDFPHELQHTLRTAQCRVIQMEKSLRSRNPRNMGRATLHVLHPPRKPTGSVAGITGPDGIHEGSGVRVVLANRESILLDQVLPPSCFYATPKGITMHVFSEENGGVRERGGVGTWVVKEIVVDGVSFTLILTLYGLLTR
jgi:hypothetical protein